MKYLIANWKQNITSKDIPYWVELFSKSLNQNIFDNLKIVVAPSFPQLHLLNGLLIDNNLNLNKVSVSAQNVSPFQSGSHTGEVGVDQISDVCTYVIVGHSESRAHCETYQDINSEISLIINAGLIPIICFSSIEEFNAFDDQYKNNMDILFAYEPTASIGTGLFASAEELNQIRESTNLEDFIYGGSVDKTSISNYLKLSFITGFLVGGASLDPIAFAKLANIVV
ncbi:hypothetical protein CO178_02220 [candidate division WWE3 bacterium CG_4_9_14_3_um_filter_34_6]|uniref:Triosephosphate isomerase n=1 Tax=candidate division WWE3 bacterium CG_4_9_14_3_um_filter_34_6 TaxID=1975079 RepID=A0A2M7X2N6_UNCKA|nr:MAG: hypothetical protein CO178_02220 [candidate division WWE3 bacterium CG_4_9_14_3_um_filter_34_6]